MAIIIEDGTLPGGSPPPNSYVTVAQFQAFYEARNDTTLSEADDTEVEAGLIKATDYMTQRLRLVWKGSRVTAFQPLDWPRRGVDVPDFFDPFFRNVNVPVSFQDTVFIGENVIPQEVKDGQIFFAAATFNSSGVSSVSDLQATLERLTSKEKVGGLEVEYFGASESSDGGRQTNFYYNAMKRVDPFVLASSPHTGSVIRS